MYFVNVIIHEKGVKFPFFKISINYAHANENKQNLFIGEDGIRTHGTLKTYIRLAI